MEHFSSVLAFAALIAAQFFGVVFVAVMGDDACAWKGRLSRHSGE
jgi:hypothetical protein